MKSFTLVVSFFLLTVKLYAQQKCGSDQYRDRIIKAEKNFNGRLGGGAPDQFLASKLVALDSTITIYVVVHVLYTKEEENEEYLPSSMIDDQLEQVNKDFSATNEDLLNVPNCFKKYIANCKFRFVRLGDVRYKPTKIKTFYCNYRNGKNREYEQIKFSDLGGDDAVATSQVLNIWIGKISDLPGKPALLGYGSYAGKIDMFDGIVLNYKAVGASNGKGYHSLGRTLTHELGHWLDVYHLWGDKKCGDDLVKETPKQEQASTGLPHFPQPGCEADSAGIMFMNFMDYTDDNGRYMFTIGQRDRMRALFVQGGKRASMMQVTFANNFTSIDSVHRNDILTPVINSITDAPSTKRGTVIKKVSWRSTMPDSVASYDVYYRELGKNWKRRTIQDQDIVINDLVPGRVYEVSVAAVLKNESETTLSPPYIFYTTN